MLTVNTSYKAVPWADVLYAMDFDWWQMYGEDERIKFNGARYSTCKPPRGLGVQRLPITHYGNSGAAAISMAAQGGAERIVLLGYDCQRTGGKAHWHGDHPSKLGNAARMNDWADGFRQLAQDHKSITIVNASRDTALDCFKRVDLQTALGV